MCASAHTARHKVDDVLGACEELLAEDRGALRAELALARHQQVEVLFGLGEALAQLDAVRAAALDRLDDEGHLLRAEGLDLHPRLGLQLAHAAQPSLLDLLLLELLVAAVLEAALGGIAAHAEHGGHVLADLDAAFAARDDMLCQHRAARAQNERRPRRLV